jgi:hypothetical protein
MTSNLYDINISNIANEYNKQFKQTPLSQQFFDENNIRWICYIIEIKLNEKFGKLIFVPINNELIQTMFNVCSNNSIYAYYPQYVKVLNNAVIEHEYKIQASSVVHQLLYKRYMIYQNRVRVLPYGKPTKMNSKDISWDTSTYYLNNPWKKRYNTFLSSVLHLNKLKNQ